MTPGPVCRICKGPFSRTAPYRHLRHVHIAIIYRHIATFCPALSGAEQVLLAEALHSVDGSILDKRTLNGRKERAKIKELQRMNPQYAEKRRRYMREVEARSRLRRKLASTARPEGKASESQGLVDTDASVQSLSVDSDHSHQSLINGSSRSASRCVDRQAWQVLAVASGAAEATTQHADSSRSSVHDHPSKAIKRPQDRKSEHHAHTRRVEKASESSDNNDVPLKPRTHR